MKVIGKIYETKNYSKFKKLKDNRIVTGARTSDLIESISKRNLTVPIIINEKFEILDGQGRFEARKALGLPIPYIIEQGGTIEDCILLNRYNKPWALADFINTYADQGDENYIRLRELLQNHRIGVNLALRLAGRTNRVKSTIQDKTLKFSEQDYETVLKTMAHINEIKEALCLTGRVSTVLATAIKVMMDEDGYDSYHMLKACKRERSSFALVRKLEDQLKELSRIYNKGLKGLKKKYFEDYMRTRGSNVRDYESNELVNTQRKLSKEGDVSTLQSAT